LIEVVGTPVYLDILKVTFKSQGHRPKFAVISWVPVKLYSMERQGIENMASAERESITKVWCGSPSGDQKQSPWSGVGHKGEVPLKLKALKHLYAQGNAQIFTVNTPRPSKYGTDHQ